MDTTQADAAAEREAEINEANLREVGRNLEAIETTLAELLANPASR